MNRQRPRQLWTGKGIDVSVVDDTGLVTVTNLGLGGATVCVKPQGLRLVVLSPNQVKQIVGGDTTVMLVQKD